MDQFLRTYKWKIVGVLIGAVALAGSFTKKEFGLGAMASGVLIVLLQVGFGLPEPLTWLGVFYMIIGGIFLLFGRG